MKYDATAIVKRDELTHGETIRVPLGCLLATERTGGAEADDATWLDCGGISHRGESLWVGLPTTFHLDAALHSDVASEGGFSSALGRPSVCRLPYQGQPFPSLASRRGGRAISRYVYVVRPRRRRVSMVHTAILPRRALAPILSQTSSSGCSTASVQTTRTSSHSSTVTARNLCRAPGEKLVAVCVEEALGSEHPPDAHDLRSPNRRGRRDGVRRVRRSVARDLPGDDQLVGEGVGGIHAVPGLPR